MPNLTALVLPALTTVRGNFVSCGLSTAESLQLPSLEVVSGNIHLYSSETGQCLFERLHSLAGFNRLQRVGGELRLTSLGSLDNLHGFDNLSYAGSVHLDTVRDFDGAFPVLSRINTTLSISGGFPYISMSGFKSLQQVGLQVGASEFSDLKGLAQLHTVGNVGISLSYVESLSGLQGLTSSGGLSIRETTELCNLDALTSLRDLGSLILDSNKALVNIDGLSGLKGLPSIVKVTSNPSLASIDGLKGLEVAQEIQVFDNDVLHSLEGFANLQTIGNDLVLSSQTSVDLDGFRQLQTINGTLKLYSITVPSIDAFNNLETIGGKLWLQYVNGAFSSMNGFQGLKQASQIQIGNIPSLTSFNGFNKLETVQNSISIALSTVSSFDGFQSLRDAGALTISLNDATTFQGFAHVQAISLGFYI